MHEVRVATGVGRIHEQRNDRPVRANDERNLQISAVRVRDVDDHQRRLTLDIRRRPFAATVAVSTSGIDDGAARRSAEVVVTSLADVLAAPCMSCLGASAIRTAAKASTMP